MESDLGQLVLGAIANMVEGGYPDLINQKVVAQILARPDSFLEQWIRRLRTQGPQSELVNLLCTVAGALNLLTVRAAGLQVARQTLDSAELTEQFIRRNYSELLDLSMRRTNDPTAPQRAISLAHHFPRPARDGRRLGVIELGCSRGDLGIVLTQMPQVLAGADQWFFSSWSPAARQRAHAAPGADAYLGVDLEVFPDDEWLLALWGLGDQRRRALQAFYAAFRPVQSDRFRLVQANACEFEQYRDAVDRLASDVDDVVVITSFVMYQLSVPQRWRLAESVAAIQARIQQRRTSPWELTWLNQGMPIEKDFRGEFNFTDLVVSKLRVADGTLTSQQVARLANDLCDDWVDGTGASQVIGSLGRDPHSLLS